METGIRRIHQRVGDLRRVFLKFSVITPLYNGARFIRKTLDSALAQTYRNFEIVLVNDESPDDVGSIVKDYIATHPEINFVYVEQKNKGLGGARNTAIRYSSGDIIAILDQDDIWYPEKLEKVAGTYADDPDASIVCHRQYIRQNGKIIGICADGSYEKDMHRKLLFSGNPLSTSATTFKKSVIEKVGYFSEDIKHLHFVEDYELWLRMARQGFKFVFLPDIMGEYIKHDFNYSSASYKSHELMCNSQIYVINLHYSKLANKQLIDSYLIRRRRAELFFVTAQRIFFQSKHLFVTLKYLFKMFMSDPFYLFFRLRIFLSKKAGFNAKK
ncbi:MAG: family 2 glycosyl transferase [Candidatus Saganbacteria bacterium]|uniref:Family 2 glycosyl transferase n=1 Tax=Candidatus Saganbacteria bacterium TaxID=2575572 RepID=A0A833L2J7_UNCSA|nr:MAG: family 2 glycosyl transferase [Candidatus Saganbacteria bacterium]